MSLYKVILISLLFFYFSNNSFAQFDASIWAGVNSSSFGGNPPKDANYESIYGLALGGDFGYYLTNDVIIALEPSFEQSGSDIVFGNEENLLDTVITIHSKAKLFWTWLII